jgi:hypothetical protein
MNPEQIEQSIRQVSNRIAEGVRVCSDKYRQFVDADREYDRLYAHAYLDADGPAHAKRYEAEIVTTDARERRDVADAAYRYADRTAKALDAELRAYQSVGASIRSMYQNAGRGEW